MSNRRALSNAVKESKQPKQLSKPKDIILDPMGQWKHPGENTRIPSNNITMQGVSYPVLAKPNVGQPVMMQPGAQYTFPRADYVDEFPKFAGGGMVAPTMDENGEPRCPDGYEYNSATGYCEKNSRGCPEGFEIDPETGKCIEGDCKPGYVKNQVGNCVPDVNALKQMYPVIGNTEYETLTSKKKFDVRDPQFEYNATQTCPPNHYYNAELDKCLRYYTADELDNLNDEEYGKLDNLWEQTLGQPTSINLKTFLRSKTPKKGDYTAGFVPDANMIRLKIKKQPEKILTEQVEETQRAVPKFDDPELNLKKGTPPKFIFYGPLTDRKHIHYDNPFIVGTSNRPLNWAPYSAALRAFTGYKKGDEKEYWKEVKAANAEGRPIDFKGIPLMGKTDLKKRRLYKKALKDYEKNLPAIELENERRRQQHEQELKGLNLRRQAEEAKRIAAGLDPDALVEWKKGGGLKSKKYSRSLEATNKFFREHSFFEKPKKLSKKRIYDPNARYYQDGGLTVGTSTSYPSGIGVGALANYVPSQMANLKLANSFKFKDVKTPLEVSVGTPLGGVKSRSNTYQGFMHPDDQKSSIGDGVLPEDAIQANKANFSNWQSSNKGAPIDLRVKQSFFGIPQDKNNPLRGFASVQGGYHPQTGFNAGIEGGVNLVLSRNGQANRYFSNRGLIPKQTVFVPQLTMGYGVRQKQAGWKEDTLNEYENLLNQDAQNNTTGSIDYLNKEVKKGNLSGGHGNVAFRPQLTVESRPTRSPLTLHGTVGANVNLAGGNRPFGPEGSGVKAKTNVYGEVGARYPVDKLFDKKSKAKSKIQEVQDREQEYEKERPVKPVEQKEPKEQTEWIGEHPRWLRDGGSTDNYVEIDIPKDQIQKYVDGGYIVEDISVPELNTYAEGGEPCPDGYMKNWLSGECISLYNTDAQNLDEFTITQKRSKKNLENKVPKKLITPSNAKSMNYDWKKEAMMPDSFTENVAEFIDPTGHTSWDDAYRAYTGWDESGEKLPSLSQAADMFGAVPVLGKFGKLKYLVNGEGLVKSAYKYFPWQQVVNAFDTADDIETDNVNEKKNGGSINYQLGDEIDEATMKRLKKLGYTFEEI